MWSLHEGGEGFVVGEEGGDWAKIGWFWHENGTKVA